MLADHTLGESGVELSVLDIQASFAGDMADRHELPAYEGSQSIEGIARALILTTSYVATGVIRKRWPFPDEQQLILEALEPGSFRARFKAILDDEAFQKWAVGAVGAVAVGVASNLVYDVAKHTFNNVAGIETHTTSELMQTLLNKRGVTLMRSQMRSAPQLLGATWQLEMVQVR